MWTDDENDKRAELDARDTTAAYLAAEYGAAFDDPEDESEDD